MLVYVISIILFGQTGSTVFFRQEGWRSPPLIPAARDYSIPGRLVRVTDTFAVPVPMQYPLRVTKAITYPVPRPIPVRIAKPILIRQPVPIPKPHAITQSFFNEASENDQTHHLKTLSSGAHTSQSHVNNLEEGFQYDDLSENKHPDENYKDELLNDGRLTFKKEVPQPPISTESVSNEVASEESDSRVADSQYISGKPKVSVDSDEDQETEENGSEMATHRHNF